MRAKITIILAGGLVAGCAWLWLVRDAWQPAASDAPLETGMQRGEQAADSRQPVSAKTPAAPSPGEGRTGVESQVVRSPSSSRRAGPARRAPGRRRARDVETGDPGRAVDDAEAQQGSENVARIRQLLNTLRDGSRRSPGGDPTEPIPTNLGSEDVLRLDLDRDRAISPWELERTRRLLERAEKHPVKNDLGDGAYPVERGEYRRQEWEFDAVDENGDDVIDVDEYYSFLFDAEQISVEFDTDGNRRISRDESRLAGDEFESLDSDGSGSLEAREIRRGVALGAFD